jgi:nitrogen regulatory protein PII-like uncharacterized protein
MFTKGMVFTLKNFKIKDYKEAYYIVKDFTETGSIIATCLFENHKGEIVNAKEKKRVEMTQEHIKTIGYTVIDDNRLLTRLAFWMI